MNPAKRFADYRDDAHLWVTLANGEYYPDVLPQACDLYGPVLIAFGERLKESASSADLFMSIASEKNQWMRIQLSRVFKKYVSPETPVEMLKKKSAAKVICDRFGSKFREIGEVQRAFATRPVPDEALSALLWEYKDRGKKGYDLTQTLFGVLRGLLPDVGLIGPERAGRDVLLGEVFEGYPKPNRPVDFVISEGSTILAIGLARYDSDRGGAQEDDRTGGYRDCANEILSYARERGLPTKVIFVNDGPGLLLGSMWNDYAALELMDPKRVMVVTLMMLRDRLSLNWLRTT